MCDVMFGDNGRMRRHVCGHSISPQLSHMESRTLNEIWPTWTIGDPPPERRPRTVYSSGYFVHSDADAHDGQPPTGHGQRGTSDHTGATG